jgi:PAS domain-containing protein
MIDHSLPDFSQRSRLSLRTLSAFRAWPIACAVLAAALRAIETSMVGAERTTLEIVLAISAVVAAILSFKGMRSKWRLEEVRIHYRSATESASEGFYMGVPVKGLDGSIVDFRLVDCNQRAAAMVGLSKEVMIGRLISELYPGEDMKRVMPVMVEAMRSGFYEDETPVPDGSILKPRWLHRKIMSKS